MKVGKHKRVYEYDGAFKCLDCERSWGCITGNPKMPKECDKEWVELINVKIEQHRKSINRILAKIDKLEYLKEQPQC